MAKEFGPYRVFGFRVRSDLALPELAVADDEAPATPDVAIGLGVAPRPPGAIAIAEGVAADPDRFWMEVPGVARILVRAGVEIVVDPAPDVDETAIRAFLLGSAMGALLHQRGLLPLHASAVRMGDGAVAFMGASGAGKSTLALHLADRGHPPLSDDVCALEIADGVALLHPGPRRMKLWRGSLTATGRDPRGLGRVLPDMDKYQLPLAGEATWRPARLRALFLLERGSAVGIARCPGVAAAQAIVANTFRGELVAPMRRGRVHFDQCMTVARDPGVLRLRREWSLDRLASASAAVERWMDAN